MNAQDVETFADEFFARQDVEALGVPGALFVVVKDGKVLLQKGYGYADAEKKVPVDPEKTLFHIASVSKVFTAAAVMQLVEQGKIELHRDVQHYLGDIQMKNDTGSPVTMEHLLTHTTGFDVVDPPVGDSISYDLSTEVKLEDYVKKWMPAVTRTPGEVYKYDNMASMLQGYIVQQVAGVPFNQYMKEHIFKPLGMNDSHFLLTQDLVPRLAVGYGPDNKATPLYNFVPNDMPHGGMLTTGSDMAKFMLAYLNKGKLGDRRILQEDTVNEMGKTHLAIHPKMPNMAYGFEYALQDHYNGQYVIGKGGAAPGGFTSWMWLLPEQNAGAFIVYNKSENLRDMIFKAFMDRYYPKQENEKQAYLALTRDQLRRFEGVYRDVRISYLITRIHAAPDGQLVLENIMGKQTAKPIDPLLFEDEHGSKIAFKANPDGSIAYMYSNADPTAWAEKLGTPERFNDIGDAHPYTEYIHGLHQLGIVKSKADGAFGPEEPLTRAEFVEQVMRWIGIPASKNAALFKDIDALPEAGWIQSAVEYGFIAAPADQLFRPKEKITRQEAAAILFRVMLSMGAKPVEGTTTGKTDAWADEAVKFIVGMKLYGPEVTLSAEGAADYKSRQAMTRQEAAALLYLASKWSLVP
ncbi:serine hydrolase [Paenibacillus dendritiformis]|uniref:serine hydrolase n=1 Tax=Paenibacillus dendritiformis TaxID=130049 RepID=UPI00105A9000|nr:serine hydrolase [Paenibacillus dendritiformis]TDL55471.1 serine hydrolase [Paenibacillus dendritiformis]